MTFVAQKWAMETKEFEFKGFKISGFIVCSLC
jgi:hypothetical protein